MREFLFRGKRMDNGEWVEGTTVIRYLHKENTFIGERGDRIAVYKDAETGNIVRIDSAFFAVGPETVGQYTGLDDTDGKPIFENDILSVRDDGGKEIYRFVVAYGVCGGVQNTKRDVGYVGFHVIPANEETQRLMDLGARNDILYWLDSYDCYVIGNIHDNPELLEVNK